MITTARDLRFSTATAEDAAAGLCGLLVTLIAWIRRYVVISDAQAVAIVLWVAHTHTIDAFDCTPYLQVGSATKRAGKTRLLEVLEAVVARPWFTGRTSAAALVRKVHATCPTLLLDESDATFGGDKEYAEALRGILNTGYRRSGKSTICVGQGSKIEVQDFSTFSAKAIAGIGKLPDTVADRSITITLRRRTTDEPCERWREREGHANAGPLRDRLATWATTAVETLRDARPALPTSIGDRQADVWEPLIAIADLAGTDWPTKARSAAITLAGGVEDTDVTVELLRDIAKVLGEYTLHRDVVASAALIQALTADEDRPWATWRKGDKPITARGLARLLEPLDIRVDQYKVAGERVRGYRRDAFDDAIARYLPSQASKRYQPNKYGGESQIARGTESPSGTASDLVIEPVNIGEVPHAHMKAEVSDGNSGLF